MKIAVYGQYYKDNTEDIIVTVLKILNDHKADIAFEKNFYDVLTENSFLNAHYPTFNSHKELDSGFDMFISIGGDGTMLRAATYIRDKNIPILGINAGRLGFLATVQQENIEQLLPLLFTKEYKISKLLVAREICCWVEANKVFVGKRF